jgi:Flp pilus assembly protein TadD
MAGIDAARCTVAADELAKDAWALAAMGDHALCLIDAGKLDEAKNRLDQLAAITPQDWRVALGRATLAEKAGDTETAQAAFVSASLAAPNDNIRTAIAERVSATPHDKETDLEIPLPTAPTAAPAPKPVH